MIPQSWNDVGPAWTVEAGLPGYACMVLVYANPKDAGQTGHPLRRIILIVIASVDPDPGRTPATTMKALCDWT